MDREVSELNAKSYGRPSKIDFFPLWWLLYPLATQAYFLIELDLSNFQAKWISEVLKGWTVWKIHSLHVATEGVFLSSQLRSKYWNVIFTANTVFPDGLFLRISWHQKKYKFLLCKKQNKQTNETKLCLSCRRVRTVNTVSNQYVLCHQKAVYALGANIQRGNGDRRREAMQLLRLLPSHGLRQTGRHWKK